MIASWQERNLSPAHGEPVEPHVTMQVDPTGVDSIYVDSSGA